MGGKIFEMHDLISVVIPVFNVEAYLDKCMASVVQQSYKELEIIVVDDGSTDNSPQICDNWNTTRQYFQHGI